MDSSYDRAQDVLARLARRPVILFALEAQQLLGRMTLDQAYALWVIAQGMAAQPLREPGESAYWRRLEARVRAELVRKAYRHEQEHGVPFDFGADAGAIFR